MVSRLSFWIYKRHKASRWGKIPLPSLEVIRIYLPKCLFSYQEGEMEGWVKVYRSMKEKGWYQRSKHVHLWIHLLLQANHKEREVRLGGKDIIIKPGQFITGRKQLSKETGISETTIERVLTDFEKNGQQIGQQKTTKNRLITIINWGLYQGDGQRNGQQTDNKRTTNGHKQERKNDKNERKKVKKEVSFPKTQEKIKEVIELLNERVGKNFQPTNQSTRAFITARLNEGRTMEDFKLVIEYKCKEWLHDEKMLKYLRPSTLFRASNFENYLVEAERVRVEKSPKIRLDRETGKAYYYAPNIKLDKEPEKAYYNNPSLKDLTGEEKERSEESRKRAFGEWRRIKGTREIDKRELEKFSNRKLEEEGNNEENG